MKEILGCKNCHNFYTGEREVNKKCTDCNGSLIPLNISSKVWKNYSESRKEETKIKFAYDLETNILLDLSIIGGDYVDYPAVIDKEMGEIRITLNEELAIHSSKMQRKYKIIKLTDITKITEGIKYTDNAKQIGLFVGAVAWIGVGIYNVSMSGDSFELIFASISGVIWGGIAWVIAKQFKEKNEVLRISTKSDNLIEVLNDVQVSNYFINTKLIGSPLLKVESNPISVVEKKSEPLSDKYDQLIKLKDLLDKGILTQDEFEKEKSKILSS